MRLLVASVFLFLFVSSNIYGARPAPQQKIIFEYIDQKSTYPGIGTYWVTDLTPKGTRPLDPRKGDVFSMVSKSDSVVLFHNGQHYFSYQSRLYRSNGTMQGTIPYRNFNEHIVGLFSYKNQICYPHNSHEHRIFCLRLKGNQASSTLLLELPRSRRIGSVAPGVFGNRLLITTVTKRPQGGEYIHELWVSNGSKAPILLATKPNYGSDPSIYVTNGTVYFVSEDYKNNTSKVVSLKNTQHLPKKIMFKNIPLPKFVSKSDLFSDSHSLYFISGAKFYKIVGAGIGNKPIALLPSGFKRGNPISVLNNHLLYSVSNEVIDKKGQKFNKVLLYKMSLLTGVNTKLLEDIYPAMRLLR